MFLSLLLIGTLACGEETKPPILVGPPELLYYVDRFKDDAIMRGREFPYPDLILSLTKLKGIRPEQPNRVGECERNSKISIIRIDKEFFEEADDLTREELMYHELGHCVLNRKHNDNCRSSFYNIINGLTGIMYCPEPESIMYPSMSPKSYKENREYYVQELFQTYNRR